MDLTVLIPCKNDRSNIVYVIDEIKAKYPDILILVVTSNKDDFDLALIDKYPGIEHINQTKPGYGAALIEGINNVKTSYFVIHNADGSFETDKIQEMYDLSNNYDFVFCDRYINKGGSEDDTLLTYLGNKIFTIMARLMLNIDLNDVLYTHVLCNTNITKKFNLQQLDFTFCIELPYNVFKYKNKSKSLNTFEKKRISGKKNVNEFKDGFLILLYIMKVFFLKFTTKI